VVRLSKINQRNGMVRIILWECPLCHEREGFDYVCECLDDDETIRIE